MPSQPRSVCSVHSPDPPCSPHSPVPLTVQLHVFPSQPRSPHSRAPPFPPFHSRPPRPRSPRPHHGARPRPPHERSRAPRHLRRQHRPPCPRYVTAPRHSTPRPRRLALPAAILVEGSAAIFLVGGGAVSRCRGRYRGRCRRCDNAPRAGWGWRWLWWRRRGALTGRRGLGPPPTEKTVRSSAEGPRGTRRSSECPGRGPAVCVFVPVPSPLTLPAGHSFVPGHRDSSPAQQHITVLETGNPPSPSTLPAVMNPCKRFNCFILIRFILKLEIHIFARGRIFATVFGPALGQPLRGV